MRILKATAFALSVVLLASLPVWVGGQGYSRTNPYAYWVPPGACAGSTSGTAAAGSGYTTTGASNTPVVAVVSNPGGSSAKTTTFICTITPPSWIVTSGTGIAIQDAVFMYDPQNYLGTQTATLASGTMNASIVFASITYPAAGASETPSTVTPVRADSGTLTITPVVASFNPGTDPNTAGSFYSVKFTPATPIVWKTDLLQLLLTVTLQNQAGLTSTTATSGVLVHFRSQ